MSVTPTNDDSAAAPEARPDDRPRSMRPRVIIERPQAAIAAAALIGVLFVGSLASAVRHRLGRVARPLSDPPAFSIDINTAPVHELTLLPGIGPELAKRIVEDRENAGPFTSPEQLERVRGIGPKTAENAAPYLRFDAASEDDPVSVARRKE